MSCGLLLDGRVCFVFIFCTLNGIAESHLNILCKVISYTFLKLLSTLRVLDKHIHHIHDGCRFLATVFVHSVRNKRNTVT